MADQVGHGGPRPSPHPAGPDPSCVFCRIISGDEPARFVEGEKDRSTLTTMIHPHNPHAPGHVLVLPRQHLTDLTTMPRAGAFVVEHAAWYVKRHGIKANIITSIGEDATQSVFHLHVHVIPRSPNDNLPPRWPWITLPRPEGR